MHEPLAQLLERTYSAAEREVIYRLIRGGGQVRHFAADPIPMETLQRILDAALDAPFVGGMPPWHLILVTSPALRARITAAVGEGRGRDASPCPDDRGQARSITLTRARLAEAPLHLAVTYDRGDSVPWGSSEPWIPPWTSSAPAGRCRTCGWRRVPKGSGWSGSGPQTRARSRGCWRYPLGCSSSPTSASACPKNFTSGPDEPRGTGAPRGAASRASIRTCGGRQAGVSWRSWPRLMIPTAQHSRNRPRQGARHAGGADEHPRGAEMFAVDARHPDRRGQRLTWRIRWRCA